MAASSSECENVQEEGDNSTGVEGEATTLLNKGKQTMVEGPGIPNAFDGRMQALMIGCKEGLKKDRKSGKKVLMEWIEGHDDSNDNWQIVTIIKLQVDRIGIQLSRMLSDFLFVMWNHEKGSENIERFRSALKWASEGANSPVIDMILTIVEMIERGLSEIKISKEVRKDSLTGKLPPVLEETELDDSNQEECSSGSSQLINLGDPFTQDDMSSVLDKFLEAGLRLEGIVSHLTIPESGFSLRQALTYMIDGDLSECEKSVESVEEEMKKLEETHPLEEVLKDIMIWQTQLSVECKIHELWRHVQSQASKETEVEPNQSEKRKEKPFDGNCCCS